jgi:diguanylate cyclase
MPSTDTQPDGPPDQQEMVGGYQEIVATLIRSLIRVPGFPASHRDRLYAFISEIKKLTRPEDLSRVSKQLEEFCTTAVAEIDPQGSLADKKKELQRIVAMLGESIRTISKANASTGNSIDLHLTELSETVVENGEPVQFARKIEAIANSIKQTTQLLKSEIEESRKQVRGAGQKIQDLENELKQTRAESLKDDLTGLFNRRSFNQFIAQALSAFDPHKPWCVIMLDVDHFKRVNDTHGHIIGDALLIKLSRTLRDEVVAPSYLARYGGEEFVIMRPASSLENGIEFCDNLLRKVRNSRWLYRSHMKEMTITATLSAGISMQTGDDTPESLVARADEALYLAKQNERDRLQSEVDIA